MDNLSFNVLKEFAIRQSMSLLQLDAVMNANTIDVLYSLWQRNYVAADDCDPHYPECNEEKLLYPTMPFHITFEGRAALEEETKSRKSFQYNEFRAWLTLAIALAAFVKSFFFT